MKVRKDSMKVKMPTNRLQQETIPRQPQEKILGETHPCGRYRTAGEDPQSNWKKRLPRMRPTRLCCVCEKKLTVVSDADISCAICGLIGVQSA